MKIFYNKFLIFLHPFILGIFPILWLYINNIDQLTWKDVSITLFIIICLILLLYIIISYFLYDFSKAAIFSSLFLLLFFSYNHVFNSIIKNINSTFINSIILFTIFGFFILLFLFLKNSKSNFLVINKAFSIIGITSLTSLGYFWLINEVQIPRDNIAQFVSYWRNTNHTNNISLSTPDVKPNIFYIILDAMGGSEILKTRYNIDISQQLNELENLNFSLPKNTYSNYGITSYSLASSLNFMYLSDLSHTIGITTTSAIPLEIMIEYNKIFQILKEQGYKIAVFSDEYTITDITTSDIYLKPGFFTFNAFQYELIQTTPLPQLSSIFLKSSLYDKHRNKIQFTFDQLELLSKEIGPLFVFAHIMAPHPPFVYDSQGNHIQPNRDFSMDDGIDFIKSASEKEYLSGYGQQAIYILDKTIYTANKLIENSNSPPIIIIQGDHGPRSIMDWSSMENSDLNEAMSIANYFYFPDSDYDCLYNGITPVNTFRIILNQFFGGNLELLNDKIFYRPGDRRYEFIDITKKIKSY